MHKEYVSKGQAPQAIHFNHPGRRLNVVDKSITSQNNTTLAPTGRVQGFAFQPHPLTNISPYQSSQSFLCAACQTILDSRQRDLLNDMTYIHALIIVLSASKRDTVTE
jgi:hypothetical protein